MPLRRRFTADMRPAAPESGRRANNATGVIRRCADVSWRITARGYSPYAASKPTQPHAVMRPAAPESGRRANNAIGVIRRCTDVSWRITASGYSPYAASKLTRFTVGNRTRLFIPHGLGTHPFHGG
ncbi:hypothetical protein VNPA152081_60350 [Pseudomonas aeruginosa]|nr:hypothetical protein VNPA141826_50760 [Pseudomonas aeruginosa]GLF80959.1 hypothetical protein VNPA152081_60350 [Pseudomonas aeruginosa]